MIRSNFNTGSLNNAHLIIEGGGGGGGVYVFQEEGTKKDEHPSLNSASLIPDIKFCIADSRY